MGPYGLLGDCLWDLLGFQLLESPGYGPQGLPGICNTKIIRRYAGIFPMQALQFLS